MPVNKVSDFSAITSASSDDVLLIINDPTGTPTSKKISVKHLFSGVPANTAIAGLFSTSANTTLAGSKVTVNANTTLNGTTTVSGDKGFVLSTQSVDAGTSNAVTESLTAGTIFYSNTYMYIVTDSNTVKRVTLETF
jgi:hypothetical protein